MITMPNVIAIFTFFKMAAIGHLGFVCRSIFRGFYWCAKFGWNPYRSFDNIKVWIFRAFGLKMPIHAPKIIFCLRDLTPEMGGISTPKRHILAWKDVIWRADCQNWSTGTTFVRDAQINKQAVLSQRWPRDAPYIWVPWKFLNVHRKFEMRSLSRSWDNSDWSFCWGLWILI